jgi:hypothetical protein
MNKKIFVSIASYRDSDCINTINNLFSTAKYPNNLVVGICFQHTENEFLILENYKSQVKIIDIPYQHSKGVCWARSLIQSLYDDEDFFLQLDSHMRFVKDWDEKLINIIDKINKKNVILSTYPLPFTPPDKYNEDGIVIIKPSKFDEYGLLNLNSGIFSMDYNNGEPFLVYLLSAGFLFSYGSIVKEIPYDPNLYFIGEEITFALRCWTKGWDIYNPGCVLSYHNYNTYTGRARHWEDKKDWYGQNKISIERINKLFDKNRNLNEHSLGIYDIGTIRSVEEFENIIGIDYNNKIIKEQNNSN